MHKSISWGSVTIGLILLVCVGLWALGSPAAPHGQPLDLVHNGVHGPYNISGPKHELLLFNFRAVEPGVLYRGSGFLNDPKRGIDDDGATFKFLRSKGIREIVTLEPIDRYYGEDGYFDFWGKQTGYRIAVVPLAVPIGHAYDRDGSQVMDNDSEERRFGLSAAAQFIELMKQHGKSQGAVYIHDVAGKDAAGVAVAAYELWRNRGTTDPDTLWKQVKIRYVVSNLLIARDWRAAQRAGLSASACPGENRREYVCGSWIDPLRRDLELIAQLG